MEAMNFLPGMGRPQPQSSSTSYVDSKDQQSLMERRWRNFKNVADSWFKMEHGEWGQLMKDNLCTVAALIASITFQAALNPPCAVVQTSTGNKEKYYNTPTGCYSYSKDPNANRICTGESVAANTIPNEYLSFINFNTFSFVSALSAALLIVNGLPLRHGFPMWLLSVIMSVSLTTLALSYLYGVLMVTPDTVYSAEQQSFNILFWIWIAFSSVVVLFNTVRFFVSFLREPRRSGGEENHGQ